MARKRKPARLFQRKDDGAWLILDGGKQIRTGYGDGFREQAEEVLSEYISEKNRKQTATVELDRVKIGELLVLYGEEKAKTVKDTERLKYSLKALAPYWGDKLASEVSVDTCLEYVQIRGVASSTARRELSTLNAALKYCAARQRIPYAPIVTLPEKGEAKDRWLTEAEVDLLLSHSAPHIQRFIKIALFTGRRKRAITDLMWLPSTSNGWVDLENEVIHFLGRAKEETKKRKGIVRMPKALVEEMKSWEQDSNYVISFKGEHLDRIDKGFRSAVARAGLECVTPHTLKHTAVTWAFMNGMTLEQATEYFATSRDTLENTYRSYSPDAQKDAAKIMNWRL